MQPPAAPCYDTGTLLERYSMKKVDKAADFNNYLRYIYKDRGLSRNTMLAYQRDLKSFGQYIADKKNR